MVVDISRDRVNFSIEKEDPDSGYTCGLRALAMALRQYLHPIIRVACARRRLGSERYLRDVLRSPRGYDLADPDLVEKNMELIYLPPCFRERNDTESLCGVVKHQEIPQRNLENAPTLMPAVNQAFLEIAAFCQEYVFGKSSR